MMADSPSQTSPSPLVADEGNGAAEVMAFSLTDPERLTSQLEHAQLDDEETEILLSEALKLNAKLKEALRKQQLATPPSEGGSEVKGRSHGQGRSQSYHHGGHGGGHQFHSPLEDAVPRRQPVGKHKLPPITATGASKGGGGAKTGAAPPPGGEAHKKRQGSAAKRKNRPAWDDRFSYS